MQRAIQCAFTVSISCGTKQIVFHSKLIDFYSAGVIYFPVIRSLTGYPLLVTQIFIYTLFFRENHLVKVFSLKLLQLQTK